MANSTFFNVLLLCFLLSCTSLPPNQPAPAKVVVSNLPTEETVKLHILKNKLKSAKIDLILSIKNDTKVALDLSKAIWTLDYDSQRGSIYQNDFERAVIGPMSGREGLILFKFDKSFYQGKPFVLSLSNLHDINGKLLAPIVLKGTFTWWQFKLANN